MQLGDCFLKFFVFLEMTTAVEITFLSLSSLGGQHVYRFYMLLGLLNFYTQPLCNNLQKQLTILIRIYFTFHLVLFVLYIISIISGAGYIALLFWQLKVFQLTKIDSTISYTNQQMATNPERKMLQDSSCFNREHIQRQQLLFWAFWQIRLHL